MDASHALVVGGTGMLRGVVPRPAGSGRVVSVVARGGLERAIAAGVLGAIDLDVSCSIVGVVEPWSARP